MTIDELTVINISNSFLRPLFFLTGLVLATTARACRPDHQHITGLSIFPLADLT
jgi:hypothetical protein